MFNPQEVAQTIERRREWIRRLWCEEMDNGVVYREAEAAVQAMANKGFEVSRATEVLARGEQLFQASRYDELLAVISEINQVLREAPRLVEPIGAPNTLSGIRASWPHPSPAPGLDPSAYYDRVLGGWLGKNIGCSLGGELEGWTRQMIEARYGFVCDYLHKPPSTLNDDITFEIVFLHALETYGLGMTSLQLGREWVSHLPLEYCYTAEKIALQNLMRGVVPPDSGCLGNPFSEWIGAQMKGEVCGLIAPGRPELAAEYAYRDGVVAHEREGVYGEIFVAAAVSAAFASHDLGQVIETALRYVPPQSKYASTIRQTLQWCRSAGTWQEVCQQVQDSLGREYHWVHVLPNAAVVIIALLFGQGDFARTVGIATSCGFDVDSNGGVAGGIVGVLVGAAALPDYLKDPLGAGIDTWVTGYERVPFDDLARRTCAIGKRLQHQG